MIIIIIINIIAYCAFHNRLVTLSNSFPHPPVPNLAGETLNWLPYGNSSIPRAEPTAECGWEGGDGRWRGSDTGQRSVCVCVGEDLGSFTALLLAGLISLICRQSGPQLRAEGLKAWYSRKTRLDCSSHPRTCIISGTTAPQTRFLFKGKEGNLSLTLFVSPSRQLGNRRRGRARGSGMRAVEQTKRISGQKI